jgi:hypothetical protein
MFIPDPDLDFLPILDPGVKKAPDLGFATHCILNRVVDSVQICIHLSGQEKGVKTSHNLKT